MQIVDLPFWTKIEGKFEEKIFDKLWQRQKTTTKQKRQPGIEARMEPAPEYTRNYVGSKKLLNKVAL